MSQKIKIRNNKINKNNAFNKNKKKKVKFLDTNLIEKEMLKGQVHEDPNINSQQNLNVININENEKNDNNEIKEETKKEIIIRPRENYLKDKIKKSFSQLLITTVNKTIDNKIKDIKNEIKNDKVLVKSNSKNLKKLIPSKKSHNTNFNSEENYILRNKYKEIKELKDQEKIMKNKLAKILSNEKFIKEKELYNSQRQLNIRPVPTKINISLEERLKLIENEKIQQQKEELLYKIANTKEKINDLINIKNEEPKKTKLKNFLINFENDKKIAEIKAKKYFQESKEIKQHMKNDIKELLEKKKKEIEEEEEKQKNIKDDYLKKFILNIKEKEGKRAKECNKKASLFQSFSFCKPKMKAEECLYNINTEKYLVNEFNFIKEEKNKKKIFMKSISREELNEFSKSYDHYKNEYNKKSEERQKELFDEWKRRKEQLPNYYGSFLEIADLESKKNEEIEKEKKEKKENLIRNKKDYSLKIKEEKKPVISNKLKKKRLNDIFKRDNPKLAVIKDFLLKRKEKTNKNNMISKVSSTIKSDNNESKSKYNSKSLNSSKQKTNIIKELNKSEIINQKLIHKPTKIKFKNSSVSTEDINISKKERILQSEKIFLSDNKIYKDNEDKNNKDDNLLSIDTSKKKYITKLEKWNNLINEKRNNLLSNIETVKNKAENIDKEFDRNEKILKLSGGIASNPQLGKKVSNLILDSIQAKLSILNKINKQI